MGLALPFIALVGLYHRLAPVAPRVANASGALMVLTPVLVVIGLLSLLFPPLPESPYLLWLSPLPYIAGVGSFGAAFVLSGDTGRFVGIPILGFSGVWLVTYAIGLQNGGLPAGIPFVELLAVSLVAAGYLLSATAPVQKGGTAAGS